MRDKISVDDLSSQAIQEYQQSLNALLEKVPPGNFNIVELKPRTLKVQPNTFFNDLDLFKELQQSSLNWDNLFLDNDGNPRIKRGWIFEWVWSDDLLLKLMSCKGVRRIEAERVIQSNPFQFIHQGSMWVGIPLELFPKGLPSSSMYDWQLAYHETSFMCDWQLTHHEKWYWVCSAETLVMDWFKQKVRSSIFYNPMAQFLNPSQIKLHLDRLGLVEWFRTWLDARLSVPSVLPKFLGSCWSPENWAHPSDEWFAFYELSQSLHDDLHKLVGGDAPALTLAMAHEAIANLKEQAALCARDESRKTAKADARQALESRNWTKPEILELADKFEVKVKKSDPKPKLIESLLSSEQGQKIAELVVGIPANSEQ
jgi:histone H3/H4